MTYVYPDDRPRRPRLNFSGISKSAQLALVLGGLYLFAFLIVLVSNAPAVGGWVVNTFGLTASPLSWKAVYQILTYALVHSFDDPLHVVMNAILLFFCGSVVEMERGPRTMLTVFVSGVVSGGLAFVSLEWIRGGDGWPLIGASAGCYALLAAAAVIHPNLETFFRIPLWILAAIYVAIDALRFATSIKTGNSTATAYVAHLGGAAAGLALAIRGINDFRLARLWIFNLPEILREWRDARRAMREVDRERRLDRILEQIHRDGISALSSSDKKFLKETSSSLQGGQRPTRERATAWMGSDERR